MTDEDKEKLESIKKCVRGLMDATDIPQEEKDDCAERMPEYLAAVVVKSLQHDGKKDISDHLQTAILGFVGGYAARYLYAYKKKMEFEKGNN